MVMDGMVDIYKYSLMVCTLTGITPYHLEVDRPYLISMYFKVNQSPLDITLGHSHQRIIIGYMQDQTLQVLY